MRQFGGQTEFGRIKWIALKSPVKAFLNQDRVNSEWRQLNYHAAPDFNKAVAEYERFVELIAKITPEITFLEEHSSTTLDSIYCRDAALITDRGLILAHMGKEERTGEPRALAEYLAEKGIPILGEIIGDGKLEGGDLCYLNERTLAIGEGYRTNAEGIEQLRTLMGDLIDELVLVPLPHFKGPADVFHLMSIISPLDNDLAVVYSPLMPVRFRRYLLDQGFALVEVPDDEFPRMACNVLALAPRVALMLEGNPITERRLRDRGVELLTYKGDEISRKGEGGPTCLTRPLWRE
jgi:N-dimethylarginine dimethylaminohydrolase